MFFFQLFLVENLIKISLFSYLDKDNPELHTVDKKHSFQPPHFDAITEILMHQDTMFSSSRDGIIKNWDLSTNSEVNKKYSAHNKHWVTGMSWVQCRNSVTGKDERLIASVGRDKSLKVWGQDLKLVCEVNDAHAKSINCVASSGNMVYTGSDDSRIHAYQLMFD